jgi:osmotically-inducible protein OsmY
VSRGLAAAALVLAAALAQGCELALIGAGAAAFTALGDRRTAGAQLEDEAIELRAAHRIRERYGGSVHVNVVSYNRAVLITGEVADAKLRADIEKLVLALPNVRGAANELELAGVASFTSRANDSLLTSKIRARFLNAKRFSALHVKVVTEAGVVYLMGMLTEREAEAAVDIARTTGGVRKVVKIFEYCKVGDEVCRGA